MPGGFSQNDEIPSFFEIASRQRLETDLHHFYTDRNSQRRHQPKQPRDDRRHDNRRPQREAAAEAKGPDAG